jgi:hypothetical protein
VADRDPAAVAVRWNCSFGKGLKEYKTIFALCRSINRIHGNVFVNLAPDRILLLSDIRINFFYWLVPCNLSDEGFNSEYLFSTLVSYSVPRSFHRTILQDQAHSSFGSSVTAKIPECRCWT